VPTEEEIKQYYNVVWQSRNMQNVMIIKTLLYTGIRVSELVRILLSDVDFDRCQIRINQGKGKKDRIVRERSMNCVSFIIYPLIFNRLGK
jgi:integrase/recombinase XerD